MRDAICSMKRTTCEQYYIAIDINGRPLYSKTYMKFLPCIYNYTQLSIPDRDMITRVLTSVTKETSALNAKGIAVSLIKLQTNGTQTEIRESIRNTLSSVSIETVGRNFVAVVGMDVVEILMEYAKDVGLVSIKNQWLYVISDANAVKSDVSHLRKLLREGDNVAFIYNTTSSDSSCAVIIV